MPCVEAKKWLVDYRMWGRSDKGTLTYSNLICGICTVSGLASTINPVAASYFAVARPSGLQSRSPCLLSPRQMLPGSGIVVADGLEAGMLITFSNFWITHHYPTAIGTEGKSYHRPANRQEMVQPPRGPFPPKLRIHMAALRDG